MDLPLSPGHSPASGCGARAPIIVEKVGTARPRRGVIGGVASLPPRRITTSDNGTVARVLVNGRPARTGRPMPLLDDRELIGELVG
jgi:hypothetical protein